MVRFIIRGCPNITHAPIADAARRVQAALKPVILRRTKETELDGRKLIELPPRNEDWVALQFSPEELEM